MTAVVAMRRAILAALGVALMIPGLAGATEFKGATQQGKRVVLRTTPDDTVKLMQLRWRTGDCSNPRFVMRTTKTFMVPPLDRSRSGSFADRGQYRVRYSDARVRYRVGSRGSMISDDRWKGTFTAKAWLTFNDGSKMTCRLRRIGWHAEA
jgi:hypothetical protein